MFNSKVFSTNDRAILLYDRLGFVREGVRRKFAKTKDGRYFDDVIMAYIYEEDERDSGKTGVVQKQF